MKRESFKKILQIQIFIPLIAVLFTTDVFGGPARQEFAKVTANGGLNLRASADKSSEVMLLLPQDTRVRIVENSGKEETIAGKKGHWAKVAWIFTEGWVFDAFLEKIDNNDPAVLFIQSLENSIQKDGFEAIDKAVKKYREIFSENKRLASVGFWILNEYVKKNQEMIFGKDQETIDIMFQRDQADPEVKKFFSIYENHGMVLMYPEGTPDYYSNNTFYAEVVKDLSPELMGYFRLDSSPIAEDAGISVPWDSLRTRIIAMEIFLDKYPAFDKRKQLESKLDLLVRNYLEGMDNTPSVHPETNNLYDEPKESLELFLKENKTSRFYPQVKTWYDQHTKDR